MTHSITLHYTLVDSHSKAVLVSHLYQAALQLQSFSKQETVSLPS